MKKSLFVGCLAIGGLLPVAAVVETNDWWCGTAPLVEEFPAGTKITKVGVNTPPWTFLHDPALIIHKGILFGAWYNCTKGEMVGESVIRGSWSADGGKTWTEPTLFAADPARKIHYVPPAFGSDGEDLFLFVGKMTGPDRIFAVEILKWKGERWERVKTVEEPFLINSNAYRLPDGRWICGGRAADKAGLLPQTPAVMISKTARMDGDWEVVRIGDRGGPDGKGYVYPETALIVDGSNVTAFTRCRQQTAVVHESTDGGRTWDKGHFAMLGKRTISWSKMCGGMTKDGRRYLVCNLDGKRYGLTVLVTEKGQKRFSRAFTFIRGEEPDIAGGPYWLYPSAVEHDGRIAVLFTASMECAGFADVALESGFPDFVRGRLDHPMHLTALERYAQFSPYMPKALAFLQRKDLNDLKPGRYEIDGDNCWAMILEGDFRKFEPEMEVEAHRDYIDIHRPLSGKERFGIAHMENYGTNVNYDAKKDVALARLPVRLETVYSGEMGYAIFLPPYGAHAPGCNTTGKDRYKKLVIKVRAHDFSFHSFEGFKPDPKLEVATDGEVRGTIQRICGITGWYGTYLNRRGRVQVKPGETTALVTLLVRGEGDVRAWVECYGEKGHIGRTDEVVDRVKGEGWRFLELRLPLRKGTTSFDIAIGRREQKEKDFDFADVRATAVPELPTRELTPTAVAYREDFEGGERVKVEGQGQEKVKVEGEQSINRLIEYSNNRMDSSVQPSERVAGILAEGLGERTHYGLYRAKEPLQIFRTKVAAGAGEVVSSSFRLYGFSAKPFGNVGSGRIVETIAAGDKSLALELSAASTHVVVEGRLVGSDGDARFRVPVKSLPADFRLDVAADGGWDLTVTSLADSSKRRFVGAASALGTAKGPKTVTLGLPDAGTMALVDRLEVVAAKRSERPARPPFKIERAATFDPVKAGWREVMRDDFDGTAINTNIWRQPHWCGPHPEFARLDGKGHLLIRCGYDAKLDNVFAASIWSRTKYLWGYFEARIRFTQSPGWNAAYWMYGTSNSNPFLDGHEIDIFEDYYTRAKPGEPSPKRLDHNNHFVHGAVLKSWNYNSTLPRGIGDWYVLGCKRTPFETTYYLDGKAIATTAFHSPWDTLTFDPFNHAAGTRPLHVIFQSGVNDAKVFREANVEEDFAVDWVRVCEMPDFDKAPSVIWLKPSKRALVAPGQELAFKVAAKPKTEGAKVESVYLFDNGNFIDYRLGAEAEFAFPFSKGYFDGTDYMKPGRSGAKPPFDGSAHVFIAFAQDDKGRVGYTEKLIRIPAALKSAPAKEGPQAVPGTVLAKRHDAGGSGVSYFLRPGCDKPTAVIEPRFDNGGKLINPLAAGDWMNFTVEVAAAGEYAVAVDAEFNDGDEPGATWLVDGETAFSGSVSSARLRLPAGRHVLTLVSEGSFQFSKATFAGEMVEGWKRR